MDVDVGAGCVWVVVVFGGGDTGCELDGAGVDVGAPHPAARRRGMTTEIRRNMGSSRSGG